MKTFFTLFILIGAIICGVSFFAYFIKGEFGYGWLSMFIVFIVLFKFFKKLYY